MKRFSFLLICTIIVLSTTAQAPQLISFQAVVRDAANSVVANKPVGMRISILQGTAAGTTDYEETQKPTSNANGLVSIQIGAGTVVKGSFATINWAAGPFFIKTETDTAGGTNYTITGTTQLLSVPYALYAGNSGPAGKNVGDMLYWNGTQWALVPAGLGGQVLTMAPTAQGTYTPKWFGPSAPVFTTLAATNITYQSALVGANITSLGGLSVQQQAYAGVIFSTTPLTSASLRDSLYFSGATTFYPFVGKDTIAISGLKANTTYYVMAYVQNSVTNSLDTTGNNYPLFGNQVSFTTTGPVKPLVTTEAVTAITKANATGGGYISSDGGAPIKASGIVWGTSPNPDTTSKFSKTNNGSSVDTGSFFSAITGLLPNTTYYVRAYAINSAGIAYGNQVSFKSNTLSFAIGEYYGGGIIFYIDKTGQHGLIAAKSDQSNDTTGAAWWNGTIATNGISDSATAIGTGAANTNYILKVQGPGIYAASLCHNYKGGGYTDWYLPSLNELDSLFSVDINLGIIGVANSGLTYWSSSEYSKGEVQVIDYNVYYGGLSTFINQSSSTGSVRAIRSF